MKSARGRLLYKSFVFYDFNTKIAQILIVKNIVKLVINKSYNLGFPLS